MLTVAADFLIIVLTVAVALLFRLGLNRLWPWESRRNHNDLIGWQLSVLGTTYAVILGFMLYTVSTDLGVANLNVDLEANSLVNDYLLATACPPSNARESSNWRAPMPRQPSTVTGRKCSTIKSPRARYTSTPTCGIR